MGMQSITASQSGTIQFWGSRSADLFTRELSESFKGVLQKNRVSDPNDTMLGFVSASIEGRPWTDTMWTRDAGCILREMVMWGYLDEACQTADCLMKLVRPNREGYLMFPMYFKRGEPASGSELDGTAAILIGFALLWERLEDGHPTRGQIQAFFEQPISPLRYMLARLKLYPLIPGSGEFGGGLGTEGEFYNVVQNNLARLALLAAGRISRSWKSVEFSDECERAASQIEKNLLANLVDVQDGWIWTVDTASLRSDPTILNSVANQGFGGLNGVLAMSADVSGLTPLDDSPEMSRVSLQTLDSLFQRPLRHKLFEKYGVWTQFDRLCGGMLTSPSYGQGYAIQALLLADRIEMAGRGIEFLTQATFEPFPGNRITRESPYYFYERIWLPELLEAWTARQNLRHEQPAWIANSFDGNNFDEGCGALNLVNVAEPLKIARLILGVEDANLEELRLISRLPPGWSGCKAENWPVLTPSGLVRVSIEIERCGPGLKVTIDMPQDASIPRISARLPDGEGWRWQEERHPGSKIDFE